MSKLDYEFIQAKCYQKGYPNRRIEGIVLHSTDGHKAGDIATLTGTDRNVSVHWYVAKDGSIYHFVADDDIAYHAGEVLDPSHWSNRYTVGIETEHMDGEENWTQVQLTALARLIVALRRKHGNIPIKGHASICKPVGRKEDPKDFPWDKFSDMVKSESNGDWYV